MLKSRIKIVVFLASVVTLIIFQNCSNKFSSQSAVESSLDSHEQETNCLDSEGVLIAGCVPTAPDESIRSCEIEHGLGVEKFDGT